MERTEEIARRYCALQGVDLERLDAETASIVYSRPVDGMKSHGWFLWSQVEREACEWCRGTGEFWVKVQCGEGQEKTTEQEPCHCERCGGNGFILPLEKAVDGARRETGPGSATDFTRPLES